MVALAASSLAAAPASQPATRPDVDDRLTFQTGGPWSPRVQLNADAAIVYGIDARLPERIASWRQHGYQIQVMTGVAWGNYQDYLHGRYDGKHHEDEGQTDGGGHVIGHGPDVPYMSPGAAYGEYLSVGVRRALDAGAEAIYLEEPEFWVNGGWEENFRREWKAYYHADWQAPDSSSNAQYRASKLKYYLYRRALAQVFASVKQYGQAHGRKIPCYVPTHSLLNYAHWRIVSPESSLLEVGCDGYIAQVWTGTARTPNVYEGREKERTFETAFLEYGAMQNLVRASGRRVWYLNDPVEDDPHHTWTDYRSNWESTLVASLLQPEVDCYEIMPWPQRIFEGKYPSGNPANPGERVAIPSAYETELQAVISALRDMKQPADRVRWEACGTRGVGVLVADTMMFQRAGPGASDPHLGSFYGLAMPLVKRGVPVEPVQIESAAATLGFLDRYRVLLLTYEGQKPPTPTFHAALAAWVKAGGALVVIDDDKDSFNAVQEWWNTGEMKFATPRHHLFDALGLAHDARGTSAVGKGTVVWEPLSPAALTYKPDGANKVRELTCAAAERVGVRWSESSALVLRRGPYVIAAGVDEAAPDAPPVKLTNHFIPLFDPALPIAREFTVGPGTRALLLDLDALPPGREGAIAAACRVRDEAVTPGEIRFRADGVEGSAAVVRVALPKPPASVTVGGKAVAVDPSAFSEGTYRLRFTNAADGIDVEIRR